VPRVSTLVNSKMLAFLLFEELKNKFQFRLKIILDKEKE
jgi:hypothetical protein